MEKKQLDDIQSVFDGAVASKRVAGVNVLVYKDDSEVGYWQAGCSDIDNKKSFSRDTICRMYSMTKTVTSVAAMQLVEQGKIDLGEDLGTYIPEFYNLQVCTEGGRNGKPHKSYRNILIQDLMNMTSGYTYGAWSENCPAGEHLTSDLINELNQSAAGANNITTQDVALRLAKIPVSFEPGTDYQYGLSADIMGAVIERVSGMKLSEYMKKNIFEPIHMNDTAFYVPQEKQTRLSKVYKSIKDESGKRHLEPFTNCNLGIQAEMDKQPAFESGGAGLCSTVDDFMKFARMLTNGGELDGVRILKEKTVQYLTEARLRPDLQKRFDIKMEHMSGYTYCNYMRVAYQKGMCKAITEDGEFGWDGWLGPYLSVDLKNRLAIVMTMQLTDAGTTEITRKVKNIIYTSL